MHCEPPPRLWMHAARMAHPAAGCCAMPCCAAPQAPPPCRPAASRPLPAGGGNGAGVTAKLCNNLVLGVSMAAVSEGLALGKQLGLVREEGSAACCCSTGSAGKVQIATLPVQLAVRECWPLPSERHFVPQVALLGNPQPSPSTQPLPQDPALLSEIFNTSSARCWSSGGRAGVFRSLAAGVAAAQARAGAVPAPPPLAAPADTYNPLPGFMEGVPASRGYKGGFASRLMVKARVGAGRSAAAQGSWGHGGTGEGANAN